MKNGYEQMIDIVDEEIQEVEQKITCAESELELMKACRKVYKVADKDPETNCDLLFHKVFGGHGSADSINSKEFDISELSSYKNELLNFKDYIKNVAVAE